MPPKTVLLQTSDITQRVLSFNSATITFDDTLYLQETANNLIVAPIAGTSVISVNGITRIVQPGLQITLPITHQENLSIQISNILSEPTPLAINISTNYLFQLERTVRLPQPLVTPIPTNSNTLSDNSEQGCVPPEGWTGFYTVERGDTLSAIAQAFEVSVADFQEANCILNANILNPGDVLRVPQEQIIVNVSFQSTSDTINNGECTQLSWQAELASVVYFEGNPVARSGTQEVCPTSTRTYALLVVSPDGNQIGYTTTVTVSSN